MSLILLLAACGPTTVGFDDDEPVDSEPMVVEDVQLYINEFMASNSSWALEPDVDMPLHDGDWTPDWIELYNPSAAPIDLAGFSITDDLNEPQKHVFGELGLPAGGYLLLYADGEAALSPAHLDFKLSADGEELGLFSPDGLPLDQIEFTNQIQDIAAARVPDMGPLALTNEATPGATNPDEVD